MFPAAVTGFSPTTEQSNTTFTDVLLTVTCNCQRGRTRCIRDAVENISDVNVFHSTLLYISSILHTSLGRIVYVCVWVLLILPTACAMCWCIPVLRCVYVTLCRCVCSQRVTPTSVFTKDKSSWPREWQPTNCCADFPTKLLFLLSRSEVEFRGDHSSCTCVVKQRNSMFYWGWTQLVSGLTWQM